MKMKKYFPFEADEFQKELDSKFDHRFMANNSRFLMRMESRTDKNKMITFEVF